MERRVGRGKKPQSSKKSISNQEELEQRRDLRRFLQEEMAKQAEEASDS
jgi:hypothetical protein